MINQAHQYKEKINEQKKFKRIFDSLKEPVIISQGGQSVYVNERFLSSFKEPITLFIQRNLGFLDSEIIGYRTSLVYKFAEVVRHYKKSLVRCFQKS